MLEILVGKHTHFEFRFINCMSRVETIEQARTPEGVAAPVLWNSNETN